MLGRRFLIPAAFCAAALVVFVPHGGVSQGLGPSGWFPEANRFFRPFLADATQPQYALRYLVPVGGKGVGEVSLGDTFGIYRSDLAGPWQAQIGVGGGVLSRFDLSQITNDLQVADYTGIVPLDVRYGEKAGLRLMYWHASSHLGDDFIKRTNPPLRKNVTDDFRWYADFHPDSHWRIYGGTGYSFHLSPAAPGRRAQAGVEFFSDPWGAGSFWFFGGSDLQTWEKASWNVSSTTRAGIKARGLGGKGRLSLFLEFFSGRLPLLGFSPRRETHWGIGLLFDFG